MSQREAKALRQSLVLDHTRTRGAAATTRPGGRLSTGRATTLSERSKVKPTKPSTKTTGSSTSLPVQPTLFQKITTALTPGRNLVAMESRGAYSKETVAESEEETSGSTSQVPGPSYVVMPTLLPEVLNVQVTPRRDQPMGHSGVILPGPSYTVGGDGPLSSNGGHRDVLERGSGRRVVDREDYESPGSAGSAPERNAMWKEINDLHQMSLRNQRTMEQGFARMEASMTSLVSSIQGVVVRVERIEAMGGLRGSSPVVLDPIASAEMPVQPRIHGSQMNVTAVTSHIKPPVLNLETQSPQSYLEEVERYFRTLKHSEESYVYLVKAILPKEMKLWFEHMRSQLTNWADFKRIFLARYDKLEDSEARKVKLYGKKQRFHDVTETYIFEMMELTKVCLPTEKIEDSLDRVIRSLWPEYKLHLGLQQYSSIDTLLTDILRIRRSIRGTDVRNKGRTPLPWVYPQTNKQEGEQDRGRNSFNRTGNWRGGSNSTRGAHRSGNGGRWNGNNNGNGSYNSSFRGTSYPRKNDRSQSYKPWEGQREVNNANLQPVGNSQRGRSVPPRNQERCIRCGGFGHIMRICPSSHGVAAGIIDDQGNVIYQDEPKNSYGSL